MPLEHGKSKKAFSHNIEAEMQAGKPMKQSLAIAYAVKKRGKKMAEGGMLTHSGYQSECDAHCNHPGETHPQAEYMPMHEEDHKRPEVVHASDTYNHENEYAHGGQVDEAEMVRPDAGYGAIIRMGKAHGGDVDMDMVGRVMKKRQHMYSRGGVVANADEPEADFMPDEFDDLHLDDHLEAKYPGSNEHGDEYDSNHNDIVAKAMMKRKKQRNPSPA